MTPVPHICRSWQMWDLTMQWTYFLPTTNNDPPIGNLIPARIAPRSAGDGHR